MKLLFDNNLSVKLPDAVQDFFPGSQHVFHLQLEHLSDRDIWQYALENHFSIVTKDKDFYHLANTLGYPPKIIWLTVGNCRNREVINIISNNLKQIEQFFRSTKGILILKP